MEHYYVVIGCEYGIYLESKRNFSFDDYDGAKEYFDENKYDDFVCILMVVYEDGSEEEVNKFIND